MRPRLSLPDLDFLRENAPWLAAAALLMASSSFGQTFFIAVFAGEIRSLFGLSHGAWGGLYTLATTASAAAMIFAGALTDRFRARVLGVGVLAGLALAAVLMARVSGLAMLVAALFLLRFFGQGMSVQVAMVSTSRWFVASRGRALAVATLGLSAGEALLPVAFVALKSVVDWRLLWLAVAAVLCCLVPILLLLLRHERTPQSLSADDRSTGMMGRAWSRGEVLRHWLFWMSVPALMGPPAFLTAFFFHQVHFAEASGWQHLTLVALFPAFSIANVVAMLAAGIAIDRVGAGRLAATYMFPIAGGFLLMGLAASVPVALAGLVLMGATLGMASTVGAAFFAEYYGTRHLGAIRAMATAVSVFGTALGPGLTGVLIDAGFTLKDQAFGISLYFLAAGGLAALAIARARPLLPRPA